MLLEHLRSLRGSTEQFQLTDDQWRHLIRENQTSIEQIRSVDAEQRSTELDHQQLSALIDQNNRPTEIGTAMDPLRLYLNTEQIFSLARHSTINSEAKNVRDFIPLSLRLRLFLGGRISL